ncbi:MAG TPA: efflux RND transporter periplasmic adaptor subunit [Vicinamibacterales bacterium]|jgi:membrane fusion protein, multidrug efflux system|nr:efflux RND transporter periplasmic adaptor subunit [Vicinamibacterales bacterium]
MNTAEVFLPMRTQFIVAVIAVLVTACGRGTAPATTANGGTEAEAVSPTIDVVRVVERPIDVMLEMPGELDPYEEVAIYARVTGYVKRIRVDRGSRVRTGELLAQIEAPELLAQRAEAESKVQAADAQLGVVRSKADADTSTFEKLKAAAATPGVVAGNDVVLAQKAVEADQGQIVAGERNIDAARQALNSIKQMEGYLRIIAPFDGVVTERNVHDGALVGPNARDAATTPMLRIVNRDRLRLVVPVPESYVAGTAIGTGIPFSVAAYPGEIFTGKVARIAQAIDVKTRTMAVEMEVPNRDGRLSPGAFCQVQWPIRRQRPSLLVPTGSIASTTGRTFVVRVRDGRTEWVDVMTGLTDGPLVEVFGDLHAGDEIAARGTDEVRSGTQVRTKVAPTNS